MMRCGAIGWWLRGVSVLVAVTLPAGAQRPSTGPDSIVWRADSVGRVDFAFTAAPLNRVPARATAAEIDTLRERLAAFVAALVHQPQLMPPRGFRAVASAAPLGRLADTGRGPIEAVMGFGAYPLVERLPFGGRTLEPFQVTVTEVLTIHVNPSVDLTRPVAPRGFASAPRAFRPLPRLTGRLGPYAVFDDALLVLTNFPAPSSLWRAVPLERALTEQKRLSLVWSEAWSLLYPQWRVDELGREAVQVREEIDRAIAALTPEQRQAPACRVPGTRPTDPERYVMRGGPDAPPCELVGEFNPAFLRRDLPRTALQVVVVEGFAPCLARQKEPGLHRPTVDLPCRAILDLLAGADWELVRATLAAPPAAP